MNITEQHQLSAEQKAEIVALWNSEYPSSLSHSSMDSFEAYLDGLTDPCHYFLIAPENTLLAYALTFIRDSEKWFAIIVNHHYQNQKIGMRMLTALKAAHPKLNGWVIDHEHSIKSNGTVYKTPLPFYLKNNFTIIPDIRLENDAISAVKIVWECNAQ